MQGSCTLPDLACSQKAGPVATSTAATELGVDEAMGYRDIFNYVPPSGAHNRLYGSQLHTLFCPELKC